MFFSSRLEFFPLVAIDRGQNASDFVRSLVRCAASDDHVPTRATDSPKGYGDSSFSTAHGVKVCSAAKIVAADSESVGVLLDRHFFGRHGFRSLALIRSATCVPMLE